MYNWTGTYKQVATSQGVASEIYTDSGFLAVSFPGNNNDSTLQWKLEHLDIRYNELMDVTFVRPFAGEPSCVIIPGRQAGERLETMMGKRAAPVFKNDNRRGWVRLLLFFASIIGALVALYFLLVPYVAEKIAAQVSIERETGFGESMYNALELSSTTDTAKTALANRFFAEMNVRSGYNVRITVVKSPVVNAFALPGGRIVIYTGLLDKLKSYPELAALIGHEFTHVEFKHSTRSIFRKVGSKVFISLVLGQNGAVGAVLADQADELKSLGYSRSLEKEADLNGLAILRERNIDAAGFSGLFTQLKSASGEGQTPEILASHPDLDQRIRYVKAAAGNYEVKNDSVLQSIFTRMAGRW